MPTLDLKIAIGEAFWNTPFPESSRPFFSLSLSLAINLFLPKQICVSYSCELCGGRLDLVEEAKYIFFSVKDVNPPPHSVAHDGQSPPAEKESEEPWKNEPPSLWLLIGVPLGMPSRFSRTQRRSYSTCGCSSLQVCWEFNEPPSITTWESPEGKWCDLCPGTPLRPLNAPTYYPELKMFSSAASFCNQTHILHW